MWPRSRAECRTKQGLDATGIPKKSKILQCHAARSPNPCAVQSQFVGILQSPCPPMYAVPVVPVIPNHVRPKLHVMPFLNMTNEMNPWGEMAPKSSLSPAQDARCAQNAVAKTLAETENG
jgi:hypothetical protein